VLGLQGRQTEAEILVKADLPPDQAAAKIAALRELLSKKQQQRAEK
jgi:Flp pilus assembly protein TadD